MNWRCALDTSAPTVAMIGHREGLMTLVDVRDIRAIRGISV